MKILLHRNKDSENLPDPQVLAQDIMENLNSALEQFSSIYEELEEKQDD
jgi:type I restriction enzyme M protein